MRDSLVQVSEINHFIRSPPRRGPRSEAAGQLLDIRNHRGARRKIRCLRGKRNYDTELQGSDSRFVGCRTQRLLLPRAPRSECKSLEPLAGQDYFRGSPNLQKVDLLSLSVCGCLARQLKPLKALQASKNCPTR